MEGLRGPPSLVRSICPPELLRRRDAQRTGNEFHGRRRPVEALPSVKGEEVARRTRRAIEIIRMTTAADETEDPSDAEPIGLVDGRCIICILSDVFGQ